MKRTSTLLFLESTGTTTPVPWANNAPDLSGFTDPTLSVLQKAWADFVDSGAELEIIPDPQPVEQTPTPNWDLLLELFRESPVAAASAQAIAAGNAEIAALTSALNALFALRRIEPIVALYQQLAGALITAGLITQEQAGFWDQLEAAGFEVPI